MVEHQHCYKHGGLPNSTWHYEDMLGYVFTNSVTLTAMTQSSQLHPFQCNISIILKQLISEQLDFKVFLIISQWVKDIRPQEQSADESQMPQEFQSMPYCQMLCHSTNSSAIAEDTKPNDCVTWYHCLLLYFTC